MNCRHGFFMSVLLSDIILHPHPPPPTHTHKHVRGNNGCRKNDYIVDYPDLIAAFSAHSHFSPTETGLWDNQNCLQGVSIKRGPILKML